MDYLSHRCPMNPKQRRLMSQVLKINPNQYWPETSSLKTASKESMSQLLIFCTEAISLEHYTHPG